MNRIGTGILAVLVGAALAGSPALAAKRAVRHTVTCKQIKDALDSGKSTDDVAKDLKVKESRVKAIAKDGCTPPKHTKKGTMHPS